MFAVNDQLDRSSGKFRATLWYAAGIVLAVPVPWVVFKRIRNVPVSVPLVLWCCAVALSLQTVLAQYASVTGFPAALPSLGSTAWILVKWSVLRLLTDVAVLTACGAAGRDSLRETLGHGFQYGVLIDLSMLLWREGPLWLFMAAGGPPSLAALVYRFNAYVTLVSLYAKIAGPLAAARLADRLDHVETSDPLWPQCIQCGYSLRGLRAVEAWLSTGAECAAVMRSEAHSAEVCPECGSAIAESLREWQARLAARDPSRASGPDRPDPAGLAKRLAHFRLERITDWIVTVSRFRATAAWLIALAAVAVLTFLVHSPTSPAAPLYLPGSRMWTTLALWTAGAAILVGSLLARRAHRNNLVWLAHHAIAPAIWVTLPAAMLIPLIQWTHTAPVLYLSVVRTAAYLCLGLILLGALICRARPSAASAPWFAVMVALMASVARVKSFFPPAELYLLPAATYYGVGLVVVSAQIYLAWKAHRLLADRTLPSQQTPDVRQEEEHEG